MSCNTCEGCKFLTVPTITEETRSETVFDYLINPVTGGKERYNEREVPYEQTVETWHCAYENNAFAEDDCGNVEVRVRVTRKDGKQGGDCTFVDGCPLYTKPNSVMFAPAHTPEEWVEYVLSTNDREGSVQVISAMLKSLIKG